MELDYERAERKRAELRMIAEKAAADFQQIAGVQRDEAELKKVAAEVIGNFAEVDPPEKEDLFNIGLIVLNPGGRGGGRSLKPGNVRLNMLKLMHAVAGGVASVVTAINTPWLAPFVAVRTWHDLRASVDVTITERDAAVLWTMWKHRDGSNYVAEDGLLNAVDSEMAAHGHQSISQIELDDSLATLSKISTIARATSLKGNWWLREWIQVKYR